MIPNKFIFMKVGNHAGEGWEEIFNKETSRNRKSRREFLGIRWHNVPSA